MNNWFIRINQTVRQTIINHERWINEATTLCIVVHPEDPSLQFVIVKNIYSRQCNVKIDDISSGGTSSSQVIVDISFPRQIAEQGYGEYVVNAMLMHACWKEIHGEDQTSWYGLNGLKFKRICNCQNLGPDRCNRATVTRYINQDLNSMSCHFVHVIGLHVPGWQLLWSFCKSHNRLSSANQHRRGYAVACS